MAAPLRLRSTPMIAANNVLTRGYRNGTVATYTYNANNWVCSLNTQPWRQPHCRLHLCL